MVMLRTNDISISRNPQSSSAIGMQICALTFISGHHLHGMQMCDRGKLWLVSLTIHFTDFSLCPPPQCLIKVCFPVLQLLLALLLSNEWQARLPNWTSSLWLPFTNFILRVDGNWTRSELFLSFRFTATTSTTLSAFYYPIRPHIDIQLLEINNMIAFAALLGPPIYGPSRLNHATPPAGGL